MKSKYGYMFVGANLACFLSSLLGESWLVAAANLVVAVLCYAKAESMRKREKEELVTYGGALAFRTIYDIPDPKEAA